MKQIRRPETSVQNQPTLRNVPEDYRIHVAIVMNTPAGLLLNCDHMTYSMNGASVWDYIFFRVDVL